MVSSYLLSNTDSYSILVFNVHYPRPTFDYTEPSTKETTRDTESDAFDWILNKTASLMEKIMEHLMLASIADQAEMLSKLSEKQKLRLLRLY